MTSEWKTYSVQELIDAGMLEEPMDGNHGGIHPKTSDYVSSGVPFIMANNLINGKVDYKNCAFISERQAATLRKGFSHPGDVLLTHKATIGRTAIVSDEYETIILTPQVTYYRVKEGISSRYLKYYFDSPTFQQTFSNWAGSGSTRAYLGITAQRKLPIILPSYETQLKIAECCGVLDEKIYINEQINDNLQQQVQAVYQQWFYISGQKGECGILADICDYSKDKIAAADLSLSTYYSTENMLSGKNGAVDALSLPSIAQTTKCKAGDILISNIRPYFKKIVYCHSECGCSTDVLCFTPKIPELSAYLYSILYADRFFDFMVAGSKGTKMPRGDKQQIMTYPLSIPSNDELCRFNAIAIPVLSHIERNRIENTRLSSLRDALLPKLMSGEIDVSNIQ